MQISIRGGEAALKKKLLQKAHEMENDMLKIMQFVGEKAVKEARLMTKGEGGFGDVTGNLRSSIGYLITKNGQKVYSNVTGNATGIAAFWEAVKDRVSQRNDVYQLFLVAGMDYADYVESQGYSVISQQGLRMIVDLDRLVQKYKNKKMRV